jgi:hypothetical protein
MEEKDQLFDQVKNTCVHFTGISNDTCKAGVVYKDKIGEYGFAKIPCRNKGGHCELCELPTDEVARAEVKATLEAGLKALKVYSRIRKNHTANNELTGKVTCECGGEVAYTMAGRHKHIWAKCNKCEIGFNE